MARKPLTLIALCLGLLGWISSAPALTVDDVLDLLDAGISEDIIYEQMESDGSVFYLDVDDILDLKDAGASDDLIFAMIATAEGKESRDRSYDRYRSRDYDRYYHRPATVNVYYDPFGYYWYPSPYYFTYWAPFSWFDYGFYWGSPVWWGWAHWGPRYHYYAHTAGYYWYPYGHYHHGHDGHEGRRLWSRSHSRERDHYVVSGKTPRSSRASYARTVERGKTTRRGTWSRSTRTSSGRYGLSATRTPRSQTRSWTSRAGRTRGTPKAPRYGVSKSRSYSPRGSSKATRSAPRLKSNQGSSKKSRSAIRAPSRSSPRSSSKSSSATRSGRSSGSKSPRSGRR